MSNEIIYASFAIFSFCYVFWTLFTVKKTTDYDDYKIITAYGHAKRKGLIK